MPLRIVSPSFESRQGATKFNQPLSFDTSSITKMGYMFRVRSPCAPSSTALSRPLRVHATCLAATQCPHASRAVPLPASHARLSNRQGASAFNQPLSFDTSKLTNMNSMFAVRSARALPPKP